MTYDPTVPGPTQRISDTQAPIQTNFSQANTIFDQDHYTFNDASGAPPPPGFRGFHKQVTLPESAGDPTAYSSLGSLYTKDNGTRTDLYYRYDTGTLGNSKILPISGIKVMGAFNAGAAAGVLGGADIYQSYNVGSITKVLNPPFFSSANFTILFSDPLDTNPPNSNLDYIVILGQGVAAYSNTSTVYISPTKNDRIILASANPTVVRVSFAIITL